VKKARCEAKKKTKRRGLGPSLSPLALNYLGSKPGQAQEANTGSRAVCPGETTPKMQNLTRSY